MVPARRPHGEEPRLPSILPPTPTHSGNLALPPHYLEPSRLSLYRYGVRRGLRLEPRPHGRGEPRGGRLTAPRPAMAQNVSSASIWYELELVAEHGNMCGAEREDGAVPPPGKERRLRRGDRVWQARPRPPHSRARRHPPRAPPVCSPVPS